MNMLCCTYEIFKQIVKVNIIQRYIINYIIYTKSRKYILYQSINTK